MNKYLFSILRSKNVFEFDATLLRYNNDINEDIVDNNDVENNEDTDDNLDDINAVGPILCLISSDAEIDDAVVPVVNNDVMNEAR